MLYLLVAICLLSPVKTDNFGDSFEESFERSFDEPFNNLNWKMTLYNGQCRIPTSISLSNKSLIEGRWYGVEGSFIHEQADRLSCAYWDTFIDDGGVVHDFYYVNEDGKEKRIITRGKPIGQGSYQYDMGKNNDWHKLFVTRVYLDEHVLILCTLQCFDDGTEYRFVEVGYRDLDYVEEKREVVRKVMNRVERQVGKFDRTKISYEGCHYKPKMKNPYTRK